MNKARRTKLEAIREQLETLFNELEEITSEEQDAYDNMPESLQYSERGEKAGEAIRELENAAQSIAEAITGIEDAGA